MKLNVQKRLAGEVLNCSPKRCWFDEEHLEDIKGAITKADIASLVNDGVIVKIQKKGISRFRARKIAMQKKKGKRKGVGSRKGRKTARTPRKETWINRVRLQREFLQYLKTKGLINPKVFRDLYMKSKGGFFRSKRHIQLYLEEKRLVQK